MKNPSFGYGIEYNRRLRSDWYYVIEELRWIIPEVFLRIKCFESLEDIAYFLNANKIKTSRGKAFSKYSVATILKDPFYINLVKTKIQGEARYIFKEYETLISIEDWVMAQVIIKNFNLLMHPDIHKHIVNPEYDKTAMNFEFKYGTDYYQYMREKKERN